jgi:hypothetical protein
MSATIASIAALELGRRRAVLPPTGGNPLIERPSSKRCQ